MFTGYQGGKCRCNRSEEMRGRRCGREVMGADPIASCKDLGFSPERVGRRWRVVGFKWISVAAGGDSSGSRETS